MRSTPCYAGKNVFKINIHNEPYRSRLRLSESTREREERVGYLRSECLLVHNQSLHTFKLFRYYRSAFVSPSSSSSDSSSSPLTSSKLRNPCGAVEEGLVIVGVLV